MRPKQVEPALRRIGLAITAVLIGIIPSISTAGVRRPAEITVKSDVLKIAGWRDYVDPMTGVKLSIPEDIVDIVTVKKFGRNWRSDDHRLNVDSLNFGNRDIGDLNSTLSDRDGRRISNRQISSRHLVLEGSDEDGTTFIVKIERQGDQTRGVSIVYSNSAARELAPVARRVVSSFVAFPDTSPQARAPDPVAPPPPPPAPDTSGLDKRLAELNARLERYEREKQEREAADRARDEQRNKLEKEREALRRRQEELQKAAQPQTTKLPTTSRIAFVAGINEYKTLPTLKRAANDARAIEAALRQIGFEVVTAIDVDKQGFLEKWYAFLDRIEAGGTAAMFFAGHGFQFSGANYLATIDTPAADVRPQVLMRQSVGFNELRGEVAERKPRVALFMLDACRNNPYVSRLAERGTGAIRSGLAAVDAARGTFVMYSADGGETALDRLASDPETEVNSLYTRYLAAFLSEGKDTLQSMAIRLRSDVRAAAGKVDHQQTPAYYDGLVGPVCLTDKCR
jgi:hypothetical protein